jgi:hypothetical protein
VPATAPEPVGDLAEIEADVAIEQELDREDAARESQMRRLGFSEDEIAKAHNRQPGEASRSAVPTMASIEAELGELAELRKSNRAKYWSKDVQAKEARLYELREQLGSSQPTAQAVETQGDGVGIDPELLEQWDRMGGADRFLRHAQTTANAVLAPLDDGERTALVQAFDALPQAVQTAAYGAISFDAASGWRPADAAAVQAFQESEEGRQLVQEWGASAAKNVGAIKGQMATIMQGLSPPDREKAVAWLNGLSSAQAKAVWRALTPTA